ncbi:MAG TPA: deoxyribodipyrimidine photo-lyase [Solirubrobacteraceae bacterium]|nr:deoxyribodipyrimidine photo-lyase [Solirubrobacteraceae bacterium]
MSRAVVLFTCDLRVHDNGALSRAASEHREVVPLFVLDRELLRRRCGSPNRLAFLVESLAGLASALADRGATLIVRRGDVVHEALRVAGEWQADTIHMSADTTPYAGARERRLRDACERERVRLCTHPGVTVLEPGAVTPVGGDHYRVFTPYMRAWSEAPRADPLPAPRRIAVPSGLPRAAVPSLSELTRAKPSPELPAGGEREARRALTGFVRGGLGGYDSLRDDLAAARTSHLSPYLHFGCLSPRTVLARAEGRDRSGGFARQFCWRDFHHQVLAARPDMIAVDYHPRGDRWRRAGRVAQAWRAGRTGYPIVDAGMRQLLHEGFIHNRARMIVASFLTKTLYIDWRLGAAHFAELLCDADVANNVGNWQWVAGTGNDARPNRVLNPLRQAERFDPLGDYVRRYVPELSAIEGAAVHRPWTLPARERRALDYPARIVDHELAARELHARRAAG